VQGQSVSYLITLYNKMNYVPLVVESLLAQTGDFAREYIFVDDGSTDDTLTVLRQKLSELSPAWSVKIITQTNQGPAAAFNAGLKEATCEWLKPLDGDDLLLSNATEILLAAAERLETNIAYAPMNLQGTYDTSIALKDLARVECASLQKIDLLNRSLKNAQTNPSTWLARRQLVQDLGGSDTAVFIQDYSLELKLAHAGEWAEVPARIMLQPAACDDRLSNNTAQTLHDVNLALLRFLQKNKKFLNRKQFYYGIRHAASRAWRWSRRQNGNNWRSIAFRNYMLAYFNLLSLDDQGITELCMPFHVNQFVKCRQVASPRG
jgi:glycosyltransferase involved in cell wall biosynthesis